MEKNKLKKLEGFAETTDGLVRVSIIFENDSFYGVWENDDLHDGYDTFEEYVFLYGNKVYKTKEDYKKDKFIKITDFFKEEK